MAKTANAETVQKLIEARSESYGKAFEALSADGIMSWLSQKIEFNDISMDEYRMDHEKTRAFFTGACQAMKSLRLLEHSTFGTSPNFVTWEMLLEVKYGVDEPALGIKKDQTTRIRGVSIQWWGWEGEGESWKGDVSEKAIRGWKIVKENDYMITLKGDNQGARHIWPN